MKKKIQEFIGLFNYSIIKKKNFSKIYRSLDKSFKYLIKKDNPTIIDVGAHEGESILRFRKLFKRSIIHCFEPQTKCYEKLKIYEDKSTKINMLAVGSKEETKKINIHPKTSRSSILEFSNKVNENLLKQENIKIITLDKYLEDNDIYKVDILKIDTQGFEEDVLLGCINSLKNKIKLIELEFIFSDTYEKKSSFLRIEKILEPLGFKLYSISSPNIDKNSDKLRWVDALYFSDSAEKNTNKHLK